MKKTKQNKTILDYAGKSQSFSTSSFEEDFTVEGTSHPKKLMK